MKSSIATFAAIIVALVAGPAHASFVGFSGSQAATQANFLTAAGGAVPMYNFDDVAAGSVISSLPGLNAHFAPEDAAGGFLPLPITVSGSPLGGNWAANFGNGRPAWSPWVIRPDAGFAIYAFGQVNSQGDWVRIQAFDEANQLVGTVDAQPLSHCFAGFTSTTPIHRIVITPLGNGDGLNGMDNVYISITPIPAPGALMLGAIAGAFTHRSRRRRTA